MCEFSLIINSNNYIIISKTLHIIEFATGIIDSDDALVCSMVFKRHFQQYFRYIVAWCIGETTEHVYDMNTLVSQYLNVSFVDISV